MFEAQIEYEAAQASSEALSGLITKAFDIGKAVLSKTGSGGSGNPTTYDSGWYNYGDVGIDVDQDFYPDEGI